MKKLWVCNIAFLLLAVGGFLSLLFAPLLSLNLSKMANNILEDPKFGEEYFGIPEEDVSSEGGEEGGGGLDILTSVLDADIAVTAVKLGKVATAKNAKAAFLTQFLLYKGGPIENFFLGSIVSGSVISTALLGDEAMGKIDFRALRDILFELEREDVNEEEIIDKYVDALEKQVGADSFRYIDEEEIRSAITDSLNAVRGVLGGKFSTEALVCIAVTGEKVGAPTNYRMGERAVPRRDVASLAFLDAALEEAGKAGEPFIGKIHVQTKNVAPMSEKEAYENPPQMRRVFLFLRFIFRSLPSKFRGSREAPWGDGRRTV